MDAGDHGNPFASLAQAEPADDPRAQLGMLIWVVQALEAADHPRLRPLKRTLTEGLAHLKRATERGVDPACVAETLASSVAGLRLECYELLLTLVVQVRVALRGRHGALPPSADPERLDEILGSVSHNLRRLQAAQRKADPDAFERAARELDALREPLNNLAGQLVQKRP